MWVTAGDFMGGADGVLSYRGGDEVDGITLQSGNDPVAPHEDEQEHDHGSDPPSAARARTPRRAAAPRRPLAAAAALLLAATGNAVVVLVAGQPGGGGEGRCRDTAAPARARRECPAWAAVGECRTNPDWMLANCAKSCGACWDPSIDLNPRFGVEAVTVVTPLGAREGSSSAAEVGDYEYAYLPDYDYDYDYRGGASDVTTVGGAAACHDAPTYAQDCAVWAAASECDLNPEWMCTHCCWSCLGRAVHAVSAARDSGACFPPRAARGPDDRAGPDHRRERQRDYSYEDYDYAAGREADSALAEAIDWWLRSVDEDGVEQILDLYGDRAGGVDSAENATADPLDGGTSESASFVPDEPPAGVRVPVFAMFAIALGTTAAITVLMRLCHPWCRSGGRRRGPGAADRGAEPARAPTAAAPARRAPDEVRSRRSLKALLAKTELEYFCSRADMETWPVCRLQADLRKLRARHPEASDTEAAPSAGAEAQPASKEALVEAIVRARGGTSGTTCSFCLEDYQAADTVRVLPCGHRFHAKCIDSWLQKAANRECPVCRVDIEAEARRLALRREAARPGRASPWPANWLRRGPDARADGDRTRGAEGSGGGGAGAGEEGEP